MNRIIEVRGKRENCGPLRLPEPIYEAIESWIEHGYEPGHFTTAVLCNDLAESIGRADETSLLCLADIVKYVYNEAPGPCWGSKEKFVAWKKMHEERRRHDSVPESDPAPR